MSRHRPAPRPGPAALADDVAAEDEPAVAVAVAGTESWQFTGEDRAKIDEALGVLENYLLDLIVRARRTFVQSAGAAASTLWVGSGLGVQDLTNIDGLHKAVVTVAGGALAAGFSAVASLVRGLRQTRKATR